MTGWGGRVEGIYKLMEYMGSSTSLLFRSITKSKFYHLLFIK